MNVDSFIKISSELLDTVDNCPESIKKQTYTAISFVLKVLKEEKNKL